MYGQISLRGVQMHDHWVYVVDNYYVFTRSNKCWNTGSISYCLRSVICSAIKVCHVYKLASPIQFMREKSGLIAFHDFLIFCTQFDCYKTLVYMLEKKEKRN